MSITLFTTTLFPMTNSWRCNFFSLGKKGSFLSNGEYAYILSTVGCIYFLENSGNFWRSQGNLREFFSTALVDTMLYHFTLSFIGSRCLENIQESYWLCIDIKKNSIWRLTSNCWSLFFDLSFLIVGALLSDIFYILCAVLYYISFILHNGAEAACS